MYRKSILIVLLSFLVLSSLGVQGLAAKKEIPEPTIERYPEPLTIKVQAPPFWPIVSPTGNTASMASFDLRGIDLTDSMDLFEIALFDTLTIWPEKMPPSFDPVRVMEWAKNPGIGLRQLHQQGITGQGVNVAVIDGNLLLEHEQWAGRIKMYEEINSYFPNAFWHSTGVVSALAGKTTGYAPGVNIYYISESSAKDENGKAIPGWATLTQAVRRIIDVNKLLPADEKIRVLSISNGWIPSDPGYHDLMETIKEAGEAGIFVISGNLFETHNMYFHGMDINLHADRDDLASYTPIGWEDWVSKVPAKEFHPYYEKNFKPSLGNKNRLLFFPCNKVTVASSTSADSYVYYTNNGWSQVIPMIAGLYALACQVKPDITPEIFWDQALATGIEHVLEKDGQQYQGKLINPTKLMASLQNL